MRGRSVAVTLATLVVLGHAGSARAEESAERDRTREGAISVGIGPGAYVQMSSPEEVVLGMQLRLGYATPVVRHHLRLSLDVAVTPGGLVPGSDVGTSVGSRDTAIEPTVGVVTETRGKPRAWLTAKTALGPLVFWPNSVYRDASGGILARLTAGARTLLSSSVALGVDLSGAVAAGSFKLDIGPAATFVIAFGAALVVEIRI
jgi:hypothetical protein